MERELLVCPVCWLCYTDSIKMCANFHTVCGEYSVKLARCPICRVDTSWMADDVLLKSIVASKRIPCAHCHYFTGTPRQVQQHAELCEAGIHTCGATTASGTPCKRTVRDGGLRCHQHVSHEMAPQSFEELHEALRKYQAKITALRRMRRRGSSGSSSSSSSSSVSSRRICAII